MPKFNFPSNNDTLLQLQSHRDRDRLALLELSYRREKLEKEHSLAIQKIEEAEATLKESIKNWENIISMFKRDVENV